MINFVRKTIMVMSIVFTGTIIYFVLNNILKNIKIEDLRQYIMGIIFSLFVGVFIFVKSYRLKKKICNFKLPYHYKIAFILTSIFAALLYLMGMYVFIFETFHAFTTGIGSIVGMIPAFLIYNFTLDFLKKKAEETDPIQNGFLHK